MPISLDDLLKQDDFSLLKPTKTTTLTGNETEPVLQKNHILYRSKNNQGQPHFKNTLTACLLDTCITHLLKEVMLNAPIFSALLAKNGNIARNSISGSEWGKILHGYWLKDGILSEMSAPSKFGSGKRVAGIYRLEVSEVINYIDHLINSSLNTSLKPSSVLGIGNYGNVLCVPSGIENNQEQKLSFNKEEPKEEKTGIQKSLEHRANSSFGNSANNTELPIGSKELTQKHTVDEIASFIGNKTYSQIQKEFSVAIERLTPGLKKKNSLELLPDALKSAIFGGPNEIVHPEALKSMVLRHIKKTKFADSKDDNAHFRTGSKLHKAHDRVVTSAFSEITPVLEASAKESLEQLENRRASYIEVAISMASRLGELKSVQQEIFDDLRACGFNTHHAEKQDLAEFELLKAVLIVYNECESYVSKYIFLRHYLPKLYEKWEERFGENLAKQYPPLARDFDCKKMSDQDYGDYCVLSRPEGLGMCHFYDECDDALNCNLEIDDPFAYPFHPRRRSVTPKLFLTFLLKSHPKPDVKAALFQENIRELTALVA